MISWLVALCGIMDTVLVGFVVARYVRSRREGTSLRFRIFFALAASALAGALVTGVYTTAEEALTTGVVPVAHRIAPKAFVVGSVLLVLSGGAAAAVGSLLSRGVEEITEAASKIAEGELDARLPVGEGREVKRLSRALHSMRTELEGRPYAAAFLRDAWHDLKTPATALLATCEVLEDGAMDDKEAAARFLANMRTSAEQLGHTLDDLVTLAKLETGAALADDGAVSLDDVVTRCLDRARPLADATGVKLEVTGRGGASLTCNADALTRGLANLVDNAVKQSPGGEVIVRIDGAIVQIENSPASVPIELRDRLFQRAATSRRGAGSGLGLAIARAAIEACRGRVRFTELGPPRVVVRVEL